MWWGIATSLPFFFTYSTIIKLHTNANAQIVCTTTGFTYNLTSYILAVDKLVPTGYVAGPDHLAKDHHPLYIIPIIVAIITVKGIAYWPVYLQTRLITMA